VYDAIEMRSVLEGTAARLAAERLEDRRELSGLRTLQEELETVMPLDTQLRPTIDSFATYLDLNDSFHSIVVDLAKSPMLRKTLDRVQSLPFASPSATVFARLKLPTAKELLTIASEHHNSIIEAIEHRQGSRAEGLAREHACLALQNLKAVLADKEVFNSVPGASLIRIPGVA
jgi:GntR family transcriptional regulator of vanillate catabolism